MAIYGIGDLHLDHTKEKPMGVFGENWEDHENKIFDNWKNTVSESDLILIPGDISWALKLEDAYEDLLRIDKLPGTKILTKGNHDYWWESKTKLNALNLETINYIHNDSFIYNGIGICGTRGWAAKDSEEFKEHDEKIFNRELNRLKLSLESLIDDVNKKIVMIHYPPFNMDKTVNEFGDMMRRYNVDLCVYGHLHSDGHKHAVEGNIKGIEFICISSDYIDFKLKHLMGN
ncbi:metallophosphoesterase [Clostridiisalibacter paucivorans]|uniref:metallophosphoesterase n=1 Tax=Clostridiisalibacter paucivorans TaxID=408753 RepID=UPI00047C6B1D|nr:metallophosphoesterase [Clostridiisalibacter paucivorans]